VVGPVGPARAVAAAGVSAQLEVTAAGTGPRTGLLAVAGEVDLSSARLVDSAVDAELARGRTRVVVDLRQVSFCDAAGIRALVRARDAATRSGAKLVVQPSPSVLLVLGAANAEDVVELADTSA
jgi:anti-anti-sigma factor